MTPELKRIMEEVLQKSREAPVPSNLPRIDVPPPTPRPAAPAGPNGEVIVEDVTPAGVDVQLAKAGVARMRAGFRGCYYRELKVNPTSEGAIVLTLELGSAGQVASSAAEVTGTLTKVVVDCVTARARHARFQTADAGTASVALRLRFVPPGRMP